MGFRSNCNLKYGMQSITSFPVKDCAHIFHYREESEPCNLQQLTWKGHILLPVGWSVECIFVFFFYNCVFQLWYIWDSN